MKTSPSTLIKFSPFHQCANVLFCWTCAFYMHQELRGKGPNNSRPASTCDLIFVLDLHPHRLTMEPFFFVQLVNFGVTYLFLCYRPQKYYGWSQFRFMALFFIFLPTAISSLGTAQDSGVNNSSSMALAPIACQETYCILVLTKRLWYRNSNFFKLKVLMCQLQEDRCPEQTTYCTGLIIMIQDI